MKKKEIYSAWLKEQQATFDPKFRNENGHINPDVLIAYTHMFHLGGSSVGALMGVSKWQSACDVYDKMTGAIDTTVPVHNFIFDRGHHCESFIWWQASLLLKKEITWGETFIDEDRPWSMAQVDALTIADKRPVECKCVSFNNATEDGKEWGRGCVINDNGEIIKEDDLVPVEYFLQCQKQLLVTGKDWMYLAAWLTFETHLRIYVIHRDDKLIEQIKQAEDDFMFNHVIPKVRPEEIAKEKSEENISEDETAIASDRVLDFIRAYRSLSKELKELKEQQDAVKKHIEDAMGTAHRLFDKDGNKLATRSLVTTSRFNSTKFKNEHGDMYAQYLTESKSTRLTVSTGDK